RRVLGRQRVGGVIQRRAEAGGPPRRADLVRRARLPSPALQVADPLQHPAAPFVVSLPVADRLADRPRRHAAARRVMTPRVQDPGVGPGDGTWDKIHSILLAHADAVGLIDWEVSVDSTIDRAHQHATNLPRDTGGPGELHISARGAA